MTVLLNRQQMAVLFDRDVKTLGKHVNNALAEELDGITVVANSATTAVNLYSSLQEEFCPQSHMDPQYGKHKSNDGCETPFYVL